MRIIHWANWGPRISGMYESTKDQIKYERRAGLESELADSARRNPPEHHVDGWLKSIPWSETVDADVWVLHSKFPEEYEEMAKDYATVGYLHGQAEHLMLGDWFERSDDFNGHINILWNLDATVCTSAREYEILKYYDEYGRLTYIPNSLDLERFKDVTPWEYENHPAIISCDTPRGEKLPQHIIWAMPYVRERIPDARLNLFSLLLEPIHTWRMIFCRSRGQALKSHCENIQLANRNLRPFQAGADIGFNNNYSGAFARTTMEMMALGIPQVSYGGEYTKYHARIFDLKSIAEQIERCWNDLTAKGSTLKRDTKEYARKHFDRSKMVKKYIKLYETLLEKKKR